MKNRYAVEKNIITEMDNSYTAKDFYLTDENLNLFHESGAPLYELSGGKHVLRSDITKDEKYIIWSNAPVKQALDEIDSKSIRSIREYIASLADAPEILKQHEDEAKAERAKLK